MFNKHQNVFSLTLALLPALLFLPIVKAVAQENDNESLGIQLDLIQRESVVTDGKFFDVRNYTFAFDGLDNSKNMRNYILEDGSLAVFTSSIILSGTLEVENNTNPNVRETIILPFNGQVNIEKIRENIATNQTDYVLGDGFLNIGDNLSWSNLAVKLVLYPSEDNNKLKGTLILEDS